VFGFWGLLAGCVCCGVYGVLPLVFAGGCVVGVLFAVVGGLFGRRSVEDVLRKGSGIVLGFVVDVFGPCVEGWWYQQRLAGFCWAGEASLKNLRHRYAGLYRKARARRLLYLWEPDKQANRHVLVCGGSGYGKTSFLKALVHDLYAKLDAKIIVFDFYGEYRGLIRGLGGEIVDLSREPLNPLAPTDTLYPESPRERERDLLEALHVAFPTLGPLQLALLSKAIREAFEEKGISDSDPQTWLLEPPTFEDVYSRISREAEGKVFRIVESATSLLLRLDLVYEVLSGHKGLDLSQVLKPRAVLLDLSNLPNEESKNLMAEWLLRKAYRWMKARGIAARDRVYIVVDEAHRILGGGAESIVEELVRVSRKYGGGLVLATQNASDIPAKIRESIATIIAFRQREEENLEALKHIFYGDQEAVKALVTLDRHEAIVYDTTLATGYCTLKIRTIPYYERRDVREELGEAKPENTTQKGQAATPSMQDASPASWWSIEAVSHNLCHSVPATPETSSANSTAKTGGSRDAPSPDDLSSLLPPSLRRVYRAVVEGHAYTLKLIAEKTGYAKSTVCEHLGKLRKLGLVEAVEAFNIARRRWVKYYLPTGSRESAWHRILVSMLKEYFETTGLQARVYNVKGKPDLELELEELKIAVEVETGLKHDFRRTAAMLARRLREYDVVLVVCPDEKVRDRYREKLALLLDVHPDRLQVIEYRELPRTLRKIRRVACSATSKAFQAT